MIKYPYRMIVLAHKNYHRFLTFYTFPRAVWHEMIHELIFSLTSGRIPKQKENEEAIVWCREKLYNGDKFL